MVRTTTWSWGALIGVISGCVVPDPLYQPPGGTGTDSGAGPATDTVDPADSSGPGAMTSASEPSPDPEPVDCELAVADDFNGPALPDDWRLWNSNQGSATLTQSTLRFELDAVPDAGVGLTTGPTASMIRGYAMVQVAALPTPGTDDFMFVTVDSPNGDAPACESGIIVFAERLVTSSESAPNQEHDYDRSQPLWLRLRFDPDQISYQTSIDGTAWTTIRQRPACDMGAAQVFLYAGESGTVHQSATRMAMASFERCVDPG